MKEKRYILPDERGEYMDAEEFDKELKAKIEAAEAEYERTGKDTNWEDLSKSLKGKDYG